MPQPQPTSESVTSQRDFSAGEVDADVKRDDERPEYKAGLRQCANYRILNSKKLINRPGRRALFLGAGRYEEIEVSGLTFYIGFDQNLLRVLDANGTQVYVDNIRPWTTSNASQVRYAIIERSIYITFPGMKPQVLTYDGVSAWAATAYDEDVSAGGQKRTLFYRISPKSVTMAPAALTGAGVACVFSAGMNLTPGHVGTRLRFCNRQVLITAVADAQHCTLTVIEPLPGAQLLIFGVLDTSLFYNVGDLVKGSVTNSVGIVTQVNGGAHAIVVQNLTTNTTTTPLAQGLVIVPGAAFAFTTSDSVVGPAGALTPSSVSVVSAPEPITVWDDEVMNGLRGYPASVTFDQNRLIFTHFPSVPSGIAWSWIGLPNDLYIDAVPNAAIFELAPDRCTVFDVAAGAESSEFVFANTGLWYIPISETNPLRPGSVAFKVLSSDGCANVQPRRVQDFLIYISAGLKRVSTVMPIGSTNRPYSTRDISELHSHLIANPIAIAAPTGDGSFPERYIYVLNANSIGGVSTGTVAVAKLPTVEGMVNLQGMIGWTPWSGSGIVEWIAAHGGNVLFTTSNIGPVSSPVTMVEQLDDTRYLDTSIFVNNVPSGLPPPGGKGPLWWAPNSQFDLIDQGTRVMGTYQADANGFIIPQNNAGEDLTSPTLVAGLAWTATAEPFIPAVQPGQDASQRMWKRRITRFQVYVTKSTGFVIARLFSGPLTPTSPALGDIVNERRFSAWAAGDDPTLPPPLREQSYLDRPIGRAHDPRMAVIKDTPGPLTILEIATEVTV